MRGSAAAVKVEGADDPQRFSVMAENVGYGREAPKKRGKIAVGHKTNDDALLLSRVHAAPRKESGAVAKLGQKNAAHLGERGDRKSVV